MIERAGGCLCGQVRFRVMAEPVAVRICWCRDCQRLASNGTVNILVPSSSIDVTGEIGTYVKSADSGNQVTRRFCPECGTQLFADSTGRTGLTVVRVGTLDEPSAVKPSANIWSSSAPSWACLDPSLERVERQPQPPAPKSAV